MESITFIAYVIKLVKIIALEYLQPNYQYAALFLRNISASSARSLAFIE